MAAGHFRIGSVVGAGLLGMLGIAGISLVLAGCASTTHTVAGSSSPTTTDSAPPAQTVSSTPTAVTAAPTSSTPVSSPASSRPASSRASSPRPATSRANPPSPHKVPPDAQYPAAGACATSTAAQVQVKVNPDVPTPRCVTVSAGQKLTVLNNTGEMGQRGAPVTVRWADYAPRTVQVGASTSFPQPFGTYLLPGVHFLHISQYAGSSAEIWLK